MELLWILIANVISLKNTSPNMCLFLHKKEEDSDYAMMAAIPYNQIRYIKRCEG